MGGGTTGDKGDRNVQSFNTTMVHEITVLTRNFFPIIALVNIQNYMQLFFDSGRHKKEAAIHIPILIISTSSADYKNYKRLNSV